MFQGGPSQYAANIAAFERVTMLAGEMLPLVPEMFGAGVAPRHGAAARVWLRRNLVLSPSAQGPLADHFVFHP